MTPEEIKKLAKLSRIDLSAEEEAKFQNEFGAILGYVDQVQKAPSSEASLPKADLVKNVMRDDVKPHGPGIFTEAILAQAPAREGNYFKVKKIL